MSLFLLSSCNLLTYLLTYSYLLVILNVRNFMKIKGNKAYTTDKFILGFELIISPGRKSSKIG